MNRQGELFKGPQIGFLTSEEIENHVENNRLIATRTFDNGSLESCSYDVRVGKRGLIGGDSHEYNLERESLELGPGCYGACISFEKIKLPLNIFAKIGTKRALSYDGLILLTGSLIDPGYEGHLLFGIYNASSSKKFITPSMKICSLTFYTLQHEVENPQPHDSDLLVGKFPSKFIQEMANKDYYTLAQMHDQLKEIPLLRQKIGEINFKYDEVLKGIDELTKDGVRLHEATDKLREISNTQKESIDNLRLIVEETASGQKTMENTINNAGIRLESHQDDITGLKVKFARTSAFWNVLLLIFIGVICALGGHFIPKLFQLISKQ